MPAPRVDVAYALFLKKSARHTVLAQGLPSIADHQVRKLLAELIMMRLFDDFQEFLQGVAVRLACGAPYLDGTSAVLLVPSFRSTTAAEAGFRTHNRNRPVLLKWSKPKFVRDATKHILAPNENLHSACVAAAGQLEEMRIVRNKVAHSGVSEYKNVVKKYYGAHINSASPGHLLLSPRFSPNLLQTYIQTCRAVARSVVKG